MLIIEESEKKIRDDTHRLSVIPSSRQNAKKKLENTLSPTVFICTLPSSIPFEVGFSGIAMKRNSLTLYLNRISKQISIETEHSTSFLMVHR